MSFYTEDREVIWLGSEYLRIVGLSYIMMAIAVSYISVLRSVTMVKLTMVVAVIALGLKTLLAYLLIFGIGPFPALGVRGAAIGTAFGWAFECILLLVLVYVQKTPLAANPLTFFRFGRPFALTVLRTSMPLVIPLLRFQFWRQFGLFLDDCRLSGRQEGCLRVRRNSG